MCLRVHVLTVIVVLDSLCVLDCVCVHLIDSCSGWVGVRKKETVCVCVCVRERMYHLYAFVTE